MTFGLARRTERAFGRSFMAAAMAGNGRLQPWYFLRSWQLVFCKLQKKRCLKRSIPTGRPNRYKRLRAKFLL
jgi:hypothetical protein